MPSNPRVSPPRAVFAALAVGGVLATSLVSPAHAYTAAFYVNPETTAATSVQTRPVTARVIKVIADTAQAEWMTVPGVLTDAVAARVDHYVAAATITGRMPVLTLYAIPGRDCSGSYSTGGLDSPAAYQAWISQVKAGIANRPVIVIVEPDALADATCLSSDKQAERFAMLKDAVYQLTANAKAYVYLDAGHSRWLTVAEAARRLGLSGIERARGFSLNVSNFYTSSEEQTYGEQVSAAVGGRSYVIDTSRNGNGPPPDGPLSWCNPPGRKLGVKPTTTTGADHNDALLWIKHPGESDGDCRPGEPPAGEWWNAYAADLVPRSALPPAVSRTTRPVPHAGGPRWPSGPRQGR